MNKVALITGASRGIGRAIAEKFALNGYDIVLNYAHNTKKAEETKAFLQSNYNVKVLCVKANVADETEVKQMVEKVLTIFKRVDVLINNAGVCQDCEFNEKTADTFMNVLAVNLVGPFLLSKYVGPVMTKQKYGKIVNISSNNANMCFCPVSADYDASKAGLENLTKNMAIEFAPYVNVNCVSPGWVETDMSESACDEDIKNYECQHILKGRFALPKDVANVVFFLTSDQAEYVNGAVLTVDGGMFRSV